MTNNRLLNHLLPLAYRLVKRNERVRVFARRWWNRFSALRARLRRLIRREPMQPPPRRFAATKGCVESSAAARYQSVYSAEVPSWPLPLTVEGEAHWKFRKAQGREMPEGFVATIPGGRVWSEGYVITPDNVLLEDVSRVLTRGQHQKDARQHPVFGQAQLPPIERIAGRVAVIATCSGRGYYHWMFDALPRLHLLQQAGIDWSSIDWFLVNDCVASFHFATLDALGIPRRKLLQTQWHPHIEAQELLVPSHVGELGMIPRWACDFLRSVFRPVTPGAATARVRLYIRRPPGSHRKVVNESDLMKLLESRGFTAIDPEDLSLSEQASLFAGARVIVAVHGSGLVNAVFCEPGAKILEIFHPAAVNLMYWSLASQMQLEYYYALGRGEVPPEGTDPYLNADDIEVNLAAVEALLRRAEVS